MFKCIDLFPRLIDFPVHDRPIQDALYIFSESMLPLLIPITQAQTK